MTRLACFKFAWLSALLAVGCVDNPGPPTGDKPAPQKAAPALPATPAVEARGIFDTRCVTCHGSRGLGDGPGSVALNPKPRQFSDAQWQDSVDDARIALVIVEGGPAVKLSAGMSANLDLKERPQTVAELVKIVCSFKK